MFYACNKIFYGGNMIKRGYAGDIFPKRNDVRANDTVVTIKLLRANDRTVNESFTSACRGMCGKGNREVKSLFNKTSVKA